MEQRVCQRSADALVEEDEHECGFDPLLGKAVAVAPSDAFEQAVGFHLTKVIAELGESVAAGGQAESSEDGLMDVGGPQTVELGAAAQQHLHQPHHAGIVNLDAGDSGFAGGDRQSHLLKEGKVDVDVQGLRLEAGEAVRHGDEFVA